MFHRGKNCWRIEEASRVAFLIDAEAYFSALASVLERARASILITAWDIDSRTLLRHGEKKHAWPSRLGDLLHAVLSRRPSLHVYILLWDFVVIYALDREILLFNPPWRRHKRLHFHLDGNHPMGASRHLKLVVVDDRVAFTGGIDVTKKKWDSPAHQPYDPRRVDPFGRPYEPVHDVQIIVEGNVASRLGELVRERWRETVGEQIRIRKPSEGDLWPSDLSPDMKDVPVAIARTVPEYQDVKAVREVEALYLDTISFAQKRIYIENQYLTSTAVTKALAGRLQETEGPEVVIILPKKATDWLEESTMGLFRARALRTLRENDPFNRLRVYYPVVPDLGEDRVNVHSKVMIVDDLIVRVGSSNLSNRSMGLDSECDLAIEAGDREPVRRSVALLRSRLLAEHLGVQVGDVMALTYAEGSLINAIEKLRGKARTLEVLPEMELGWLDGVIPDVTVIDTDEPVDPDKILNEFMPEESPKKRYRHLLRFAVILFILIGLAAAWQWTPLSEWANIERLQAEAAHLRGKGMAPFVVIGAYLAGSLVMFPLTLMVLATTFVFGPLSSIIYAMLGSLLGALLTYSIGHALGRETVSRLAGTRVNRLSRRLARHGIIAVTTVRLLPIAPFTIINLVMGASHIRLRDFAPGTILGTAPGIVAATLFENRLESAIHAPGLMNLALLGIFAALIFLGIIFVRRWLRKEGGPD